ncbi:MAG: protein kinase [Prevotella sp.]|nr:protein kinase [Prevotella sp.]
MNNPDNDSSDSGFISQTLHNDSDEGFYLSSEFRDLTPIHESEHGHSRVFRAQRMGKWHVLKCLKPQFADSPDYRALLRKEFELGYNLNHPNIVRTIGMEEVESLGVCIVMEYVEGTTLNDFLANHGHDAQQEEQMVRQLCGALAYIHARQMVHRDLKPSNILITDNGHNVKLIDFGLADSDSFAILKQSAGTRRYAAPEQLQTGAAVDGRADIYALGKILSELPFQSAKLQRIVHRCLQTDREKRFQNADEIIKQLDKRQLISNKGWLWLLAAVAVALVAIWLSTKTKTTTPNTQQPSPITQQPSPATQQPSPNTQQPSPNTYHPTTADQQPAPTEEAIPTLSAVSPDVAYYLDQTAIPANVKTEPRFVHLAEYAYSITTHFIKTHSINYKSEEEAFGYVLKELEKTVADPKTRHQYTSYLDVLTQIIGEDFRRTHFKEQPSPNTQQPSPNTQHPDREKLNRIDAIAEDCVSMLYRITDLGSALPATTNDAEVLNAVEQEVEQFIGKESPLLPAYQKQARAAAQKHMSQRREQWKQMGIWK